MLDLISSQSPAFTILLLGLLIVLGLSLGQIRFLGISLGSAGVLFAGLLLGHFGFSPDSTVLAFIGDFGMVLFVYTLGLQIGPAFIDSLKANGISLNILAFLNIFLAGLITVGIACFTEIPKGVISGLFSGATTNTPSLGEAQQILNNLFGVGSEESKLPGLGYAIAYPLGVLGHIAVIIALAKLFRVDVQKELQEFERERESQLVSLVSANVELNNPDYDGKKIQELPFVAEGKVAISRLFHDGELRVAARNETTYLGDSVFVRAEAETLQEFIQLVGRESDFDLRALKSDFVKEEILVTNKDVLGKTLGELKISSFTGVALRSIERGGIVLAPNEYTKLQFADVIKVIGEKVIVDKIADQLGNSLEEVNQPKLVPIFMGVAFGVLLGSLPIAVPGLPNPVRLGLACGPLLIAILFSNLRRLGKLNFYLPYSSNEVLKEMGLAFFLAAVGLRAGEKFFVTLIQGDGLYWILLGAMLTVLPALTVGLLARLFGKTNFIDICGLLSGSMTAPHVLAFTNSFTNSNYPSLAYTTVYPLSLTFRVIFVQLFLLML